MLQLRTLLLSLAACIAVNLHSAQIGVKDAAFLGSRRPAGPTDCQTNIVITLLTNLSTTTDGALFTTPVFTPASNAFIYANIQINSITAIFQAVTNTGTTNLVWWPAIPSVNGVALSAATYVTQMPIGTAPFAMQLSVRVNSARSGAEIHVMQATGANTTALWGSNAVAQASTFTANSTNRFLVPFSAPACSSMSLGIVSADTNPNWTTEVAQQWTSILLSSHLTAQGALESFCKLAVPSTITSTWVTNSATTPDQVVLIMGIK